MRGLTPPVPGMLSQQLPFIGGLGGRQEEGIGCV